MKESGIYQLISFRPDTSYPAHLTWVDFKSNNEDDFEKWQAVIFEQGINRKCQMMPICEKIGKENSFIGKLWCGRCKYRSIEADQSVCNEMSRFIEKNGMKEMLENPESIFEDEACLLASFPYSFKTVDSPYEIIALASDTVKSFDYLSLYEELSSADGLTGEKYDHSLNAPTWAIYISGNELLIMVQARTANISYAMSEIQDRFKDVKFRLVKRTNCGKRTIEYDWQEYISRREYVYKPCKEEVGKLVDHISKKYEEYFEKGANAIDPKAKKSYFGRPPSKWQIRFSNNTLISTEGLTADICEAVSRLSIRVGDRNISLVCCKKQGDEIYDWRKFCKRLVSQRKFDESEVQRIISEKRITEEEYKKLQKSKKSPKRSGGKGLPDWRVTFSSGRAVEVSSTRTSDICMAVKKVNMQPGNRVASLIQCLKLKGDRVYDWRQALKKPGFKRKLSEDNVEHLVDYLSGRIDQLHDDPPKETPQKKKIELKEAQKYIVKIKKRKQKEEFSGLTLGEACILVDQLSKRLRAYLEPEDFELISRCEKTQYAIPVDWIETISSVLDYDKETEGEIRVKMNRILDESQIIKDHRKENPIVSLPLNPEPKTDSHQVQEQQNFSERKVRVDKMKSSGVLPVPPKDMLLCQVKLSSIDFLQPKTEEELKLHKMTYAINPVAILIQNGDRFLLIGGEAAYLVAKKEEQETLTAIIHLDKE